MLKVKPEDYEGLSREDKSDYYAASLLVKSTIHDSFFNKVKSFSLAIGSSFDGDDIDQPPTNPRFILDKLQEYFQPETIEAAQSLHEQLQSSERERAEGVVSYHARINALGGNINRLVIAKWSPNDVFVSSASESFVPVTEWRIVKAPSKVKVEEYILLPLHFLLLLLLLRRRPPPPLPLLLFLTLRLRVSLS